MANAFASTKKNLVGLEKQVEGTFTIDTYSTAGAALSLGDLGMRKVNYIAATTTGGGTTIAAIAEWNGSKTAPKIALYDGTFAELAAGAVSPAIVVQIVARGA
jgi:hypothetical protein